MVDLSDPSVPQTYTEMISLLSSLPIGERPDAIFCLWFVSQTGGAIRVENNESPIAGAIKCVGSSHHPFDPSLSLEELTNLAGMNEDWNLVLVWGGKSDNNRAPSPEQIQKISNEKAKQFANGGFIDLQDAVFDRKGQRVHAIDFPDGPPS